MMFKSGHSDPRAQMPSSALDAANAYAMPRVSDNGGERASMILGGAALILLGVFVFNQKSEAKRS